MNQTEKFRKLLRQIEGDESLPQEKLLLLQLLNTLIRSNELVSRYDEYFRSGYSLGYFLIQSQRIEQTVIGVIESAENLRAQTLGVERRNIKTNRPLGPLIDCLRTYVQGEVVFSPLTRFNEYRKGVIHRLTEDFSRTLIEIECSIATDYPPEKINELQTILLEVSARINLKIVEKLDDSMVAKELGIKLGATLQRELGLHDLEFEIL